MAAVAGFGFSRQQLQPAGVLRGDSFGVDIDDVDGKGHVRGYLDLNRSIGLDGRVAENFAHTHARRAECRVVDLAHGLTGDFHGFYDADETVGPRIKCRLGRIRDPGDTGHRSISAVDIVHT